ncbi:MAG: ScyD/ScyE family protein [Acidobacteria bacterium]|nr:ScyD/ScyE family protein [Acidobacteriota bacterium]
MFTKKNLATIIFALFAFVSVVSETKAQTATTFVTGLRNPTKIIYAQRYGVFFVSEAGPPMTTNNGRISIVRNDGSVSTLIDGLPSGPSAPNGDPSGPSAMWLDGNSLYIAIGVGNATLNGPAPGSEIPNPNSASPLFSSILQLDLPTDPSGLVFPVGLIFPSYQIQPADQIRLANGETLTLGVRRNRATLRMVANFPDFTPAPRPDVPNNVRASNPFGLVGFGNKLYVADAAQNHIRTVSLVNGQTEIFFNYPPRQNPLPGPPFIDAVPDSLRLFGNKLLVTFLTGFPFPAGVSDVRQIDLESGVESQFIGGLRMAIDVLPVAAGFCHSFYTLEFQSVPMVAASGRIQRFTSPGGPPTLIINTLTSPTSLALHPPSGDLLVTEIFPGRITRISIPISANTEP